MISLPSFIMHSVVLSDEDKQALSLADRLPTDQEIDSIRFDPAVQELLNAFIGDESTRNIHLQLKAKEYIKESNLLLAWSLLLL